MSRSKYSYGTSGFRYKAHEMKELSFRMGVLVAIRSLALGGLPVGLMITASHNPEEDNGVKIIDPSGDMLDSEWEPYADILANASDNSLENTIASLKKEIFGNCLKQEQVGVHKSHVLIGRDTRASGKELSQLAIQGILKIGGTIQDFGVVTTPQLHFLVAEVCPKFYKEIMPQTYLHYLKNGIKSFFNTSIVENIPPVDKVYIDTANGVGHVALIDLLKILGSSPIDFIPIHCGSGKLNDQCGADYVKMTHSSPAGLATDQLNAKYASLDGDADRIVYYYQDPILGFRLMDGDRIACLFALLVHTHLKILDLEAKLTIGVIQTAYSNGACKCFLKNNLNISVEITCTGVKHLHVAAKKYDTGIYFEANGHGTILFSSKFKNTLTAISSQNKINCLSTKQQKSLAILLGLTKIINPYIGDAIADMFAIEGALYHLNMSMSDWSSLYKEHPSKQTKILVADRSIFKTANFEQILTEPIGIQEKITQIVEQVPGGRAFVRPSGTENVVRIYAEAYQETDVDKLVTLIQDLLKSY